MQPQDLTPPGRHVDSQHDLAELARRAAAASASVRAAADQLEGVLAEPFPSPAALTDAIAAAALAGADRADDPAAAALDLREALAGESTAAAEPIARIKALLGEDFPVLARFTLAPAAVGSIFASLADAPALLGRAPLPLHGWLEQMRRVRPELARLADCLTAAELLSGQPAPLAAFQLPHRPGSRWIGLPFGAALPDHVESSFVVHAFGLDPNRPPADFAGLLVDEWSEVVPARERVTGIALHHDAPAARAPQAALLAVHPQPEGRGWTLAMLLDTVNEALDLARMRAVRPQDLAGLEAVLPLLYLPDNPTRDVPSVDLAGLGRRAGKA